MINLDIYIYISIIVILISIILSHYYLSRTIKNKVTDEVKKLTDIDTNILNDLQNATQIGSRLDNLDNIIKNEDNIIFLSKPTYIPSLSIKAPPPDTLANTEGFKTTPDYSLTVAGITQLNKSLIVQENATIYKDLNVLGETVFDNSLRVYNKNITPKNEIFSVNTSDETTYAITLQVSKNLTANNARINSLLSAKNVAIENELTASIADINKISSQIITTNTIVSDYVSFTCFKGIIVMWDNNSSMANIPSGWALCDGSTYILNSDGKAVVVNSDTSTSTTTPYLTNSTANVSNVSYIMRL